MLFLKRGIRAFSTVPLARAKKAADALIVGVHDDYSSSSHQSMKEIPISKLSASKFKAKAGEVRL
jgi:hypothetical protein